MRDYMSQKSKHATTLTFATSAPEDSAGRNEQSYGQPEVTASSNAGGFAVREFAWAQETVTDFLSSLAVEQVRGTRDLAERARQSAISGTAKPSRTSIRRLIVSNNSQKSHGAETDQD